MTTSPRAVLLDRCLEYLQRNGFSHLSLREIAAGAGTSHRMLIYHFGSRDGLLAEIVGRIETEQRVALDALVAAVGAGLVGSGSAADGPGGDGQLIDICRAFWMRVSDPALAPAERLFFEIYAQALRDRTWTEGFRRAVIDAWEQPLTDLFLAFGRAPAEARNLARFALASTRGLLLDLLITGDREAVDAAGELFARLLIAPT